MASASPGNSAAPIATPTWSHGVRPLSGRQALGRPASTAADVDVCELYDCYTYTVLVTLEDYGFCGKGEGGAFVEDGKLAPGGSLPYQHRRWRALARSTCGA